MIEIVILPALRGRGGYLLARGHARPGSELVCNSVTAIEDCLAANLDDAWNIRATRKAGDGSYELRWNKSDRKGAGLKRANDAAGFAYAGLKRLAMKYPFDVRVEWKRPVTDVERRE